jgi:hypothetical protein
MGVKKKAYNTLVRKPEGKNCLEDSVVALIIILKWVLKKQDWRM